MVLKNILPILLIAFIFSYCTKQDTYDPKDYLSDIEKKELLHKIIPYSAKLPKGFDHTRRFEGKLDSFYTSELIKYDVQLYYLSPKDSITYFLLSRDAPSLYEKKIAIAGKFRTDNQGNILKYEEVFWTFKMKKEELDQKALVLFTEMVKGGDLTAYMPGKKEDEWIEFPDDRTFYDKKEKRWKIISEDMNLSGQLYNKESN